MSRDSRFRKFSVRNKIQNFLRHLPHEDCSFAPTTHDSLLVRAYLNFGDRSRVSISIVHHHPVVITPQLQGLILPSRHKELSIFSDSQSIESTLLAPVAHSNRLSIKAIPIRYFPIAPTSQQLTFVRMVTHLLEHRGLEKACQSDIVVYISHDARPVA